MKNFEENLTNNESNQGYLKCKCDLNYIYDQKLKDIKIRSKCNWYEDGEKSSKLFPNLENNQAIQNQICLLKIDEKEVKDQSEILQKL